jgi:hypothetical protein
VKKQMTVVEKDQTPMSGLAARPLPREASIEILATRQSPVVAFPPTETEQMTVVEKDRTQTTGLVARSKPREAS